MPTGQVPTSQYEGLGYGENIRANAMRSTVDDMEFAGDDEQYAPSDDDEAFLLSPTDRPNERLTAGMSFGPGPNIAASVMAPETPNEFANRIADTLGAETEGSSTLNAFISRIRKGL